MVDEAAVPALGVVGGRVVVDSDAASVVIDVVVLEAFVIALVVVGLELAVAEDGTLVEDAVIVVDSAITVLADDDVVLDGDTVSVAAEVAVPEAVLLANVVGTAVADGGSRSPQQRTPCLELRALHWNGLANLELP